MYEQLHLRKGLMKDEPMTVLSQFSRTIAVFFLRFAIFGGIMVVLFDLLGVLCEYTQVRFRERGDNA